MNKLFRSLFVALLACGITHASEHTSNDVFGKTFFEQRSQGHNLARWMAGQGHHIHLCDTDCMNGSLSITPHYFQTFNEKEIGRWFFFNGTDSMTFGPAGQPDVDVFARNFFLNDDFFGTVKAKPRVQNFALDINFYLGLDEWVRGLYFRMDIPINWTSWNMDLDETTTMKGTEIAANRLGNPVATASPQNSIIEAWRGNTSGGTNFPHLKEQMKFAKIDGKKEKTGVADITFVLGYDFLCNECSHFGFNARVIVPTGTRPDAEFVFEPVLGNGRHVEAGAGVSGHYELWNNGCDQTFGIFFEGNVYHMFRARQRRTFDLKNNGIGSRYLLFKKFDGSAMPAYADEVVFGPNVMTRDIRVKNDIHGEVAVMFDYQRCGITFDVGYNLWGRSRDKITLVEDIPLNTFGVQGDTVTNMGGGTENNTQSMSNIKGEFLPAIADLVTITKDDFDIESAEHPGAVSHKIFTHIAYTWVNCDYLPYVGIGGEVEFSGRRNRAFDQWGAWIKGGFTFS